MGIGSIMLDRRNRRLDYLRLSVTDRCNLRCVYCMPCKGVPKLPHEEILSYEELHRLTRIAVGLGVRKIRLTGGEPLVRKGIWDFIARLSRLEGLRDLALTTNGVYLSDKIERLKSAGIRRVNISLDSLRRERYRAITGFDCLNQVMEGIRRAEEEGLDPIKINVVLIEGLNDDEVTDFGRLSLEYPYHIRFIEYMPLGGTARGGPLRHVPDDVVKARLETLGELEPVENLPLDGPAQRFRFAGARGEIGFISALSHHFCHACNRMRLVPSGRLRPCLLSDVEEDLKAPLRRGASDEELARIFLKAAAKKPASHGLAAETLLSVSGQMSDIGG